VGHQTLSVVRCLEALICLIFIISASSCRSAMPTAVENPPVSAETQLPEISQAAAVEEATAPVTPAITRQFPVTTNSPLPPLSPTPPTTAHLTPGPPLQPELISPENVATLRPLLQHAFSPWEHVLGIAWSPDSKSLAVAAGDAVYLFDTDLQERLRLEPGAAAPAMSFSPDGKLLAAGDRNGVLHVWDAEDGEKVQEMQAHQKTISSLAYSRDGSVLATAGYDAVARLWDAGSYAELSEMIGGTFAIPAIAYSPDGSSLAIVNGNVIRLRDAQTSRFVRTIVGDDSFYSLAFSPDGSYLAAGDVDNTISIWDIERSPGPGGETRDSLHTLTGHRGRAGRPEALIWQVAYSPYGDLLASAGGDAAVWIWDAATAQPLVSLSGHSKSITSAVFSPDGRWLATGGLDGLLILWGVDQ
jgi:WD40 repeat protein